MSKSDSIDDLDLEKIARDALAENDAKMNLTVDVSSTTPQANTPGASALTTQESQKVGLKKLPSNWASMDAVARLRGATDELVKEHFAAEKKRPPAPLLKTIRSNLLL